MARKLTDIAIAARIVPTMVRWASSEGASWDRLRECVEALRSLARSVDDKCHQVERNTDLKPENISRRRIQLGEEALAELAAFEPLHRAERAVDEHIKHLDTKTQNLLARALDEVREGVAAAQRAVIERCQVRVAPWMNVRFRG